MTASAKTLRAVVRAAMAHFRWAGQPFLKSFAWNPLNAKTATALMKACARHAAALKRKRTGRR